MDYYDPSDLTVDDLVKRVRVGRATEDFIRTPVGTSICRRALVEYREGIESLQDMTTYEWSGSSDEELSRYREICSRLSIPFKLLKWLNSSISDGENAESIVKYKESGEI